MARETWVQSQVESYQRFKKWYLMLPCLALSIIRYGSRVKWSNPGKGVAPSPTHWCSSYRKGSLRVTLDYGRQLYFTCTQLYSFKYSYLILRIYPPVGWGCRINWLNLIREERPPISESPGYDTKPLDGEAPILELWEMWSTPSLPLFVRALWSRVVIPVWVPSMSQIEQIVYSTWNQLTVCKQIINVKLNYQY